MAERVTWTFKIDFSAMGLRERVPQILNIFWTQTDVKSNHSCNDPIFPHVVHECVCQGPKLAITMYAWTLLQSVLLLLK